MENFSQNDIFNRSERLLGPEAMEKLRSARVIIFGIGGVGSWTAEALVRTGVKNLTIVDADRVAVSNINRQAPATTATVGEEKTEAMRQRLLLINPEANIEAVSKIYTADTAGEFDLEEYDFIVDAIDSLSDKVLLIYNSTRARRPRLFSSMGAALKLDPTRIRVAEFWKVEGCRLAAALRRRFKSTGKFPGRKFKCVFSDELLPNLGTAHEAAPQGASAPMSFNKVVTNGSLCHITAIFGMSLAGLVVSAIVGKK